ncbi:fused (3R)-hydroxyacyl-ACP dehydratase subunits HadA/HadB [Jongsikchunia kroppenstedtii]|uniref:fused (3R)-hydroxyacyl-ACP dehydratase subunits HadA/HadB n=1 Tax=Jongsikchunia kroppenstedtii TaxID=1121721 RepID=UPI0003A5E176|nr:fused (3R)-hydroxyacyl-ACP dehydratase subunits HadA/HadB [Jongsikchunia kroppenstedtii]
MTTGELTPTEVLEQVVGNVYTTPDYYEVGREKIREFARALHDDHPAHWEDEAARAAGYSGLLAPLTIVAIMGAKAQFQLVEEVLPGNMLKKGVLQVDQRLIFHKPVVCGDRLICDVSLDSYRTVAGAADLFTVKTVVRELDKGVMQESYTTLASQVDGDTMTPEVEKIIDDIMFSGGDKHRLPLVRSEAAEIPDDHPRPSSAVPFDSVTVGQELPGRSVPFTRGDVINYVGVSGDPNPIHHSDELADKAGLKTVVAQAMLTMGTAAGYITSFVGDPAAVYDMSARFTSPVYVPPTKPAVVEYTGKIKSLDPETKQGVIVFGASLNGKRVFGRCTATVQFS